MDDTLCRFLADVFKYIPDQPHYSPDLHRALFNLLGLVVPQYDGRDGTFVEYDFEGPYGPSHAKTDTWSHLHEQNILDSNGKEVPALRMLTETRDRWGSPEYLDKLILSVGNTFNGTRNKKRKAPGIDTPIEFVWGCVHSPVADAAGAGLGDARPEA